MSRKCMVRKKVMQVWANPIHEVKDINIVILQEMSYYSAIIHVIIRVMEEEK